MNVTKTAVGLFALSAGCWSHDVFAHHSFAAEFSRDLPVEVTGTVNRVEWMNPHARLYVDVTGDNSEKITWDFELTTPNILLRRGWSPGVLKTGDMVTVTGWRARNAPHVANANSVKLSDGKQLFNGNAPGTGE